MVEDQIKDHAVFVVRKIMVYSYQQLMELMEFVLHYIVLYSIVLYILLISYVDLVESFFLVQGLQAFEEDQVQFCLYFSLTHELLFDSFHVVVHV
jgi:hypothetical protein